jgi:hypothetical protein
MRKYLFLLLLLISGASYSQYQLTGSKIRYYNGLAASTRDTSNWISADSNVVVFGSDSSLYFRAKGYWKKIAASEKYVPYVGATTDLNLGSNNIFTNN